MLPPNKNYQVSRPFRDPDLGHSLDQPNHVNPTEPRNFDEWVIVNMKNEMCKEVEISKVREVKCALAQPKQVVKEDDLNTISLKEFKKASEEPVLPAIQCTFYSSVNIFTGMCI